MKKVLVSLVLLVACTFFSIFVSADNLFQQSIAPNSIETVTLSSGYYNVTLAPGEAYRFTWDVSNLNSNNIYIDAISSVYAGSSNPEVYGTASIDISSTAGGWAVFINQSDQSISGLDLSVSVNCSIYNSNNSYQTVRANLSIYGGTSFQTSYVSNASLNDKLNQILSTLGQSSSGVDFLGVDALFYYDKRFFNNAYIGYQLFPNSDGLFYCTDVSYTEIGFDNPIDGDVLLSLSPGSYYFAFTCSVEGSLEASDLVLALDNYTVSLRDVVISKESYTGSNRYYISAFFDLASSVTFRSSTLRLNHNVRSGFAYGGIARASQDSVASGALNPSQDQIVSDVDDAGESQASQEKELWTNINTYKGNLDFTLSGWDSASSGLSYVRDIFMIIWNNSPTQIITLSLMLGIAMLSIGRGVGAAVRVSRKRGDD